MRRMAWLFSVLAIAIALGCSSDTATGPPKDTGLTITGTIKNTKADPIPENARVVIVWSKKTADSEVLTLYGEGTVNPKEATFEIKLSGSLLGADDILVDGVIGVGDIFLTTDLYYSGVIDPDRYATFFPAVIGAVDGVRVVFLKEEPSLVKTDKDTAWIKKFKKGYNVGKSAGPAEFAVLEPMSATGLELLIADLDKFTDI